MITLSVVVPATNAPPTLARCTAAIAAADDPADEVIVVEDPQLSASGARNAGALAATGDVVVFVDADVEIHADALGRIRGAFTADPDLTAVFGSYDDAPADRSVVSAFRNLLHHHVHQAGGGPAETFWSGIGAVRRTRFVAVGGFDEHRYPHPSIEDIELGDRLQASGALVELDPSVQGKHLKIWTLRSMLWTDFVRRAIPWIALQVRTGRPASTLNCGWRHRLSAVACALCPVAVVLWSPALLLGAVTIFVGLNRAFYALLVHRVGPVQALAGIGLHGLHHLVAVAAVPVGVVAALGSWTRSSGALGVAPIAGGATAE